MTRHKVVISTSNTSTDPTHDDHGGADDDGDDDNVHTVHDEADGGVRMEERWITETSSSPFLFLTLDIPPTPLFKDSQGGLIIPQIPLFEVTMY